MASQQKYPEYSQLDLPGIEKEILEFWDSIHAFERSISQREGKEPFVFYEGPPSANGLPGIHHVISRTLKDLVCRFKTMEGFQVPRKGGWDTHGLPVELSVEKELGISKEDIGSRISVEAYNKKCRDTVLKYKDQWDLLTRKMGYWVDLKHPYITFENQYIETLWWLLARLYKKGLLYESVSIQPYSPAAGTGLSSHELNQPGTYKLVRDTTVTAMFRILPGKGSQSWIREAGTHDLFFLAWTTTPWTLPSNLGLAVGPEIEYVLLRSFNPYSGKPLALIMARDLMHHYFPGVPDIWMEGEQNDLYDAIIAWLDQGDDRDRIGNLETSRAGLEHLVRANQLPYKMVRSFRGRELEGLRYEQLMAFEANSPDKIQELGASVPDPFRVVLGDFVTTEEGTGIVHLAPAFGADDFRTGKKFGLGLLVLVDRQGRFVEGCGEFSRRYVKDYQDEPGYQDVNIDLCVRLKKENRAFRIEKYEHSYPHCWRTDKPVIYYPLDAWFIRTTAYRDRMLALNRDINWKPKSTGEGRFGNWLENMVDWNLSRSRFWGTPLPVWKTEDGAEEKCLESIEELYREAGKARQVLGPEVNSGLSPETLDLHKPYVDGILLLSSDGRPMRRVPDLVDVWFDSGAMPFAQWHFPFENLQEFARNYPADFIAEGVDQTRGWFYTLHAISALLREEIQDTLRTGGIPADNLKYPGLAFRAVVSNGLVLDKKGNKMSKRLGNVVDPFSTIETFGADATRWYLITNASPWDNLKFDKEGIREVQRKIFGTLFNTYQFFALYANIDGFAFEEPYIPRHQRPEIDRWILSALHSLTSRVRDNLDHYEPTPAGRDIGCFVDEYLSNWYVRLCRRRFWKGEYAPDKISAYQTLYECLETLAFLMAPLAPFFPDWIFRNLNGVSGRSPVNSVHLGNFPESLGDWIDPELEERMQLAQDLSSLILSLRKRVNIKVRQPLQQVLVPVSGPGMESQLKQIEYLILSEVNIKEIKYVNEDGISHRVKANYKSLGSRMGNNMKAVAEYLSKLNHEQIRELRAGRSLQIPLPGISQDPVEEADPEGIRIGPEDVEIIPEDIPGWIVANRGVLSIALDIQLTQELLREGYARELVNRVQKLRKEAGFQVTDRIEVKLSGNEILKEVLKDYELYTYICTEILADSLEIIPQIQNGIEIEVNGHAISVFLHLKR